VLGISKDGNYNTARKAYLKKSKETHPDKGGNTEDSKKVNSAWDKIRKLKKWK